MNTKEIVREFILEQLGPGSVAGDLTDEYPLLEKELIDSMGVLKLVFFLENTLGIEVDDLDLIPEHFGSINAISDFVSTKQQA